MILENFFFFLRKEDFGNHNLYRVCLTVPSSWQSPLYNPSEHTKLHFPKYLNKQVVIFYERDSPQNRGGKKTATHLWL